MILNILLSIPIIYSIYLYYIKFNSKEYLFIELYLGLNVVAYCFYYLLAYRIHHSYDDLNTEAFLNGVSLFYILFLITVALIHCSKYFEKKFSYSFSIHKKSYINKSYDEGTIEIVIFLTIGFILFLINRTGFLFCEDNFVLNLSSSNLYQKIIKKLHTVSFFGFYLITIGLIQYHLKINNLPKNKGYHFTLYYIMLIIFLVLILNSSASVSLIIIFTFIFSIIFHSENKKIFLINLIFLIMVITTFQSIKTDIRKNISPLMSCNKLDIFDNIGHMLSGVKKFYTFKQKKEYFLRSGEIVDLEVSYPRFMLSNFFERVDILQMLSQTKLMHKNNELKLKLGETYFNQSISWQKKFGVDIKQANQNDKSSFNMPASVESYYNFGNKGFIIFSLIMSIIIFLINFVLKQQMISKTSKVFLITIFSPLLNLEQHLVFMFKNALYIFLLILIVMLLTKTILLLKKKVN